MPINLESFKQYAGIPIKAVSAVKAVGVLTVTKDVANAVISIPKGTAFNTSTQSFEATEDFTISESAQFLPVTVQAVQGGVAGNIPAGETWSTALAGVQVSNAGPFILGADAVKASQDKGSLTNKLNISPDAVLQRFLDSAIEIIRDLLGLMDSESLPDKPRVEQAIFLLCLYFSENKSVQEKVSTLDLNDIKETKTSYFRSRLNAAIYRQVNNLICKYRKHSRFIPQEAIA